MKARVDAILQREQAEYLDQLLPQGDRLLTEMEAFAAEHRVPIADREVAAFIEITARACGAKRALEIRSEERRVGKECRSGWPTDRERKRHIVQPVVRKRIKPIYGPTPNGDKSLCA